MPAVRGMSRPVRVPLAVVPIAAMPVRDGVRVRSDPGTAVKVLSGDVDW